MVPATPAEAREETKLTITFLSLTLKAIVVHTVTYFIMGLLALMLLD